MFAHPLALASLVIIPLAQVPLVAYLSRYVELDDDLERQDPTEGYVTYGTAAARPDRDTGAADEDDERGSRAVGTDHLLCPHCAHPVEREYEFCGNCTGRVAPRGMRR